MRLLSLGNAFAKEALVVDLPGPVQTAKQQPGQSYKINSVLKRLN